MAFRWRADDGPTLNAGFVIFKGIRTSIAKETLYFCDFLGVSGPPVPPLYPHMALHLEVNNHIPKNYKTGCVYFCNFKIGNRP